MSVITGGTNVTGTSGADILLSTSNGFSSRSFAGNNGNDLIYGDQFHGFTDLTNANSTMGTALNIDNASEWRVDSPSLVFLSRNNPDNFDPSVPNTTIVGSGANAFDWFSVTVGAGETVTLDIDYGNDIGGGSGIGGGEFDSRLQLRDAMGNVVSGGENDDSTVTLGGAGSNSTFDSFVQTTIASAGTYFIRVSQNADNPIPNDATYVLNVSVTGHASSGLASSSADSISGGSGRDVLYGFAGSDSIDGGADDDSIDGGAGNDSLRGGNGDDSINGGIGDDTITGEGGADRLDGGDGTDFLDYTLNNTGISVNLSTGATNITGETAVNFENVGTGTGDDIITGTADSNVINTDDGDDSISAGDGNDTINGGDDNDTIDAGAGDDRIIDSEFNINTNASDSFNGGAGTDTYVLTVNSNNAEIINLAAGQSSFAGTVIDTFSNIENVEVGGAVQVIGDGEDNVITSIETSTTQQDNTFRGGAGNDTIDGGLGGDSLEGGAGSDTISYARDTVGVLIDLASGGVASAVFGSGEADGDSQIGFENFIGGSGNDRVFTQDGVDNTIQTGAGDDSLIFSSGNDFYDGGDGFDTLDMTRETVGHFVDVAGMNIDDIFPAATNIERVLGGSGDDTLEGGVGNMTLEGGVGDDNFIVNSAGPPGSSTLLIGGVGDDTFSLNIAINTVFGGDGSDTVMEGGGATSGNVVGASGGGINIVDLGAGDDTLITTDNFFQGFTGTDSYDGGAGVDRIDVRDMLEQDPGSGLSSNRLQINLDSGTIGFSFTGRTEALVNFEDVIGREFADEITGSVADNSLSGRGGNDTIRGLDGDDIINGGDGNDILIAGNGADVIVGGAGIDRIQGQNGGDTISGNDGNDIILAGNGLDTVIGGNGNDIINGNANSDRIDGNNGNDTLFGGSGTDSINGGGGADRIFGQTNSDTINGASGDDFANGGGGNDRLIGSTGNDSLFGSIGNDTLFGGADDDLLNGGNDNDFLRGDAGNDTLQGSRGVDTLLGGSGEDSLQGGDGNDSLSGEDGDDVLRGANDDDSLSGGNGNDSLFGDAGTDSLNGNAGNDVVRGGAGSDRISGGGGVDRFVFDNGWGADVVTDFANDGMELLDMRPVAGLNNFAQLTITDAASGARVMFNGDSILLLGLTASDLDAGDFLL